MPHIPNPRRFRTIQRAATNSRWIHFRFSARTDTFAWSSLWWLDRMTPERNPMAQRVNIVLEDDLDGSEADETVTFALDGVSYEIDLSAKNAAALRDALAQYVGHARRAAGRRAAGRPASSSRGTGKRDLGDVREWARANGHQVSDR